MIVRWPAAAIAAAAALWAGSSLAAQPVQDRASYEAAVRNFSMSPSFVLITVINPRTGERVSGCGTVNALHGAIHREYGLPYSQAGMAAGLAKALTPSHTFRFSRSEARANLHLSTPQDREWIRAELGLTSREAILSKLAERRWNDSEGRYLASAQNEPDERGVALGSRDLLARRNALACVLIEYGFRPRLAAEAGNVILF